MTQLFGPRVSRLTLLAVALGVSALAVATGYHHRSRVGPFAGPLFGLATNDHGKLLVADASVGIIPTRYGAPIPLPGITDVSTARGATWAVTGATGAPPAGPQNDTGQGVHVVDHDGPRKVANLFAYEAANNPHTDFGALAPDSNPFDVHALGRRSALVVDAGGNDLLRVDKDGNIELLAVFPTRLASTQNVMNLAGCPNPPIPELASFCELPPEIPSQPVPTSIAVDRHGYIYVGELRGFPAPTNESSIWRIAPHASAARCGESPDCVKAFDGGFTSIIDLAFGPDGLLYVAELDEASWAAVEIFGAPTGGTINACSVKHGYCRKVARGIEEITAIAFDDDGDLWATQHSLVPGEAEVIKVDVRRHSNRYDGYGKRKHKGSSHRH